MDLLHWLAWLETFVLWFVSLHFSHIPHVFFLRGQVDIHRKFNGTVRILPWRVLKVQFLEKARVSCLQIEWSSPLGVVLISVFFVTLRHCHEPCRQSPRAFNVAARWWRSGFPKVERKSQWEGKERRRRIGWGRSKSYSFLFGCFTRFDRSIDWHCWFLFCHRMRICVN